MGFAFLVKPILIAILFSVCVIVTTSASCTGPLTLFPDTSSTQGRCMDGTVAGYYYRPALNASSNKWIINLEGGGECVLEADCLARSKTNLGSSNYWKQTHEFDQLQGCETDFFGTQFHQVFVPYCSGDLFYGQDTAPSARAFGLRFSGYHIIAQIIDELLKNYPSFKETDAVIFTGLSAGGLGVMNLVDDFFDRIYVRIDQNTQTDSHPFWRDIKNKRYWGPQIAAVPLAGFHWPTNPPYAPANAIDPPAWSEYTPWDAPAWQNYETLWNSFSSPYCIAAGVASSECLTADGSYPSIRSPVFAVQSVVDSVVMHLHGALPSLYWNPPSTRHCTQDDDPECPNSMKYWMHFWHSRTANLLLRDFNYKTRIINNNNDNNPNGFFYDGVFAPACLIHTEFSAQQTVDKLNYVQALKQWWFDTTVYNGSDTNPHVHVDVCTHASSSMCGICKA